MLLYLFLIVPMGQREIVAVNDFSGNFLTEVSGFQKGVSGDVGGFIGGLPIFKQIFPKSPLPKAMLTPECARTRKLQFLIGGDVMSIQWRQQMSVGNLILDMDHKYLISLINLVECAMRHPNEFDALEMAVNQLVNYAKEHFVREERIQLYLEYSYYLDHKLSHQKLLDRLEEIVTRILKFRESGECLKDSGADIANLLRDWLLNHVLKEDMLMKPDLEKAPQNLLV